MSPCDPNLSQPLGNHRSLTLRVASAAGRLRSDGQLGSCVSFLGTGSARLIGSGLRIPTMKILGGNKGALRIPSLSFQYLRRPGCTAKLLCFQYSSSFDPHRPYQLSPSLYRTCEFREAAKGSNKPGNVGGRVKTSRHGWQANVA